MRRCQRFPVGQPLPRISLQNALRCPRDCSREQAHRLCGQSSHSSQRSETKQTLGYPPLVALGSLNCEAFVQQAMRALDLTEMQVAMRQADQHVGGVQRRIEFTKDGETLLVKMPCLGIGPFAARQIADELGDLGDPMRLSALLKDQCQTFVE